MKAFYPALGIACLLSLPMTSHTETLEEIYELALENDAQLKADRNAYLAGKESYKIARSGLMPTISANASLSKSSDESDGYRETPKGSAPSPIAGETDTDSTGWGASLVQPLFDMSIWYGFQRGKISNELAETQFASAQQDFILRVAAAYFDVLRSIDTLETSIAEERAIGSQLEQTKQRYEVGLTAITDVHETQAEYDRATANTLQSRGNLGIAFEALEVLTGQPANAVAPIGDNFPVNNPEPANREEWVNFALENNYQLQSAKLAADSAKFSAKSAKSEHYPTVTGRITYNNSSSESDFTNNGAVSLTSPASRYTDSDNESTSVVISLDVPLFTGGRTSASRRQAHYQYLQNLELFNNAKRNTIQSARSSHLLVETSVATVRARQQAIVSSQSALEATQAGYEVGTRTLVDLLLSQRALYQSQRSYYDALYSYIINTLRLKQAAGTLSPEDILELNRWLDAENQTTRASYEN
ncbi:TolC family outer membrane protein [Aurantivibrio plasticivorans]